jgi:hypothetical protein
MRVEWGVELPREIRTVLEPFVGRYLDLLPGWCHTLKILPAALADEGEGDLSDCVMAMAADYKYRRAKLFVNPDFLELGDEEREQTVVHEFVHVLNAPLIDFSDQLIAILDAKAPDAKAMLEVLQAAGMEAATEDCAMVLWRLTEGRRHPDVDWKFV